MKNLSLKVANNLNLNAGWYSAFKKHEDALRTEVMKLKYIRNFSDADIEHLIKIIKRGGKSANFALILTSMTTAD